MANTPVASVRRTGRLVIAHEAWVTGGFGAEVAAPVAGRAPPRLCAPVVWIGARLVPIPSGPLRCHALPNAAQLVEAVRRATSPRPAPRPAHGRELAARQPEGLERREEQSPDATGGG